MTVLPFYLLIGAGLGIILFFFRPLHVDAPPSEELAQIELRQFVIFDVTRTGVKTQLGGSDARRYEDRYAVDNIVLTDRSRGHTETVRSDTGVYRDPMVHLEGHVRYERDDGVRFETSGAEFNQTSGVIRSREMFTMWRGDDRVTGQDLVYFTKDGEVSATHIEGVYLLEDAL